MTVVISYFKTTNILTCSLLFMTSSLAFGQNKITCPPLSMLLKNKTPVEQKQITDEIYQISSKEVQSSSGKLSIAQISRRQQQVKIALCNANATATAQAAPKKPVIQKQVSLPQVNTAAKAAPITRQIQKTVEVQPSAKTIAGVKFYGNTAFSSEELLDQSSIAEGIGSALTIENINLLADRTTEFYRSKGYLVARAYIPTPQEVKEGIITVNVLEGAIDKAVIQDNKTLFASKDLQKYLDENICDSLKAMCEGSLINKYALERSVGVLSDLPGVKSVSTTLHPGKNVGTSEWLFSAQAGDSWSGYITGDNYGGEYTGRNRATLGLIFNNTFGIGDQWVMDLSSASGAKTFSGQLGGSIPVGYGGGRAGLTLSRSVYELGDVFKSLQAKGEGNGISTWYSYPIIRSRESNLYTRLSADYKESKDYNLGFVVGEKKETSAGLGLNGNFIENSIGSAAYTSYGITLSAGKFNFGNYKSTVTANDGKYQKLNWTLSRDQSLFNTDSGSRFSLYGSMFGQQTQKNLDSSQKFALGGPTGIRAYPAGEGSGDIGTVGSLELRYAMTLTPLIEDSIATFAIFRERGWLTINKDPITTESNKKMLTGNGASLNLAFSNLFSIKAAYAKADKKSPKPTTSTDAKDSQLWINGVVTF